MSNEHNTNHQSAEPNRPSGNREPIPVNRSQHLQTPQLDFSEMSGGDNTVYIRFADSVYTLKRTRNNRLILFK